MNAGNLALGKNVSASSFVNPYIPSNIVSGVISEPSRWISESDQEIQWVAIDLEDMHVVGSAVLYSDYWAGVMPISYTFQCWSEQGWQDIKIDRVTERIHNAITYHFAKPVITDRIQLKIRVYAGRAMGLVELELYAPGEAPTTPKYVQGHSKGHYDGTGYVEVTDNANGMYVNADAVKFVPSGQTLLYETESLSANVSSGESRSNYSDGGASGGVYDFVDSTAVDDYISYTINVPTTGPYTITVIQRVANNRGQYQLSIDTVYQGGIQENYATTTGYTTLNLGSKTLAAGNHTFQFKVTGKNASSSNYFIAIDAIQLN